MLHDCVDFLAYQDVLDFTWNLESNVELFNTTSRSSIARYILFCKWALLAYVSQSYVSLLRPVGEPLLQQIGPCGGRGWLVLWRPACGWWPVHTRGRSQGHTRRTHTRARSPSTPHQEVGPGGKMLCACSCACHPLVRGYDAPNNALNSWLHLHCYAAELEVLYLTRVLTRTQNYLLEIGRTEDFELA